MRTNTLSGNGRTNQKKVRYQLSATVWLEGKNYVAKSPELGVASFGATPEVALKRLEEAVELYLENARLLGMLPDLSSMLKSKRRFTTLVNVTI